MSVRIALMIFLCAFFALGEGKEAERQDRMIDVGGYSLHARIVGIRLPAVVIDTGIAGLSEEWYAIQDRIGREVQVVTYDRAGYGKSEPGTLPRHSGREADELKTLLKNAFIKGPYILVGHSLGGLNMQVFAAKYPDDTAALVLLDPPPLAWLSGEKYSGLLKMALRMTDEWQAVADRGSEASDPDEKAEANFFRMIASEHREMLGESARLAAAIKNFGSLPMIIIASGAPNPMFGDIAEDYQKFWIDQSRDLSTKSSRGEFFLAKNSSHRLHEEAADLVADSILKIINKIRSNK